MKHQDEDRPSCRTIKVDVDADEGKRDRGHVLSQWPIQIKLVGSVAPFLNDADLLVAADCTAFATRGFHDEFLGDKKLVIGCPKLDNAMYYVEKFTGIFKNIPVKSLTCLRMEVPCCGGMTAILAEALKAAGKQLPFEEIIIGVKGNVLGKRQIPARPSADSGR
ncbi:MAG: hypothetical protein M0033_02620 [Nitrospiraceae bacterium]|nr:hypothetical protein [Nitrospiraceae bacterium]